MESRSKAPLWGMSAAAYRAETKWSGEIGLEPGELTNELRKLHYSEEDVMEDGVPALVLEPVN